MSKWGFSKEEAEEFGKLVENLIVSALGRKKVKKEKKVKAMKRRELLSRLLVWMETAITEVSPLGRGEGELLIEELRRACGKAK